MTTIDLGRPVQGDVVELILDDHRRFETLLRDLRDSSSDRDAVRRAFAALHVAHAVAEEKYVYVEELATAVNHHLTEEELTILNPARDEVGEQVRAELGQVFARERNAQLDAGCGTLAQLREIVAEARRKGLLDDDDNDEG